MQWYYSKSGSQLGPIEQEELRAKIASGEVQPSDLVWREGLADWQPYSRIPELQSAGAVPAPVGGPPAGPAGPVASTPYAPPVSQAPSPYPHAVGPIPNYLWQSIVVTLLCCLPFGVVAIVFAAKVDSLRNAGDIQGALAASKNAKTWCMIGGGIGLLLVLAWIALAIVGAAVGGSSGTPHSF